MFSVRKTQSCITQGVCGFERGVLLAAIDCSTIQVLGVLGNCQWYSIEETKDGSV
jgi:hypothetical protein